MSWLRSRRFYAGLLAGLVPFVLLSAQSGTRSTDDARRVIVRTYAGCCPDSTDVARTQALIDALPPDVVLVETFAGCCCGGETTRTYGATSGRGVFVPPSPITGTGPAGAPARRLTQPDIDYPAAVHPGGAPGIASLPPEDLGVPLPSVVFTPPGPPVSSGVSILPWLGSLVPVFGAVLDGTADGTICPDDSGLPIGPKRPRC